MIRLESVTKFYSEEQRPAVDALSLECGRGTITAIVGESGCGKTTTLKMINRLIEPSSGSIFVDGENVLGSDPVALRRRIGYVFQGIGLFPHYSIGANVAITPHLLGWDEQRTRERVDELLELVGLPPADYRDRYPRELSGGQQQRVGVARALAAEPAVLLMDEPFGAIDPITRDQLRSEFAKIQRALALTVVIVTHDITEAVILADRLAVMGGGRLIASATPETLMRDPGSDYVRALLDMPRRQAAEVGRICGRPSA